MPSNDVRSMTSTLASQMRNVDIDIGMSNLTDNQLSAHMSTTTSMARNDASVTCNTTNGNISPPPQPQAALSLPSMVSTNELQISLEMPRQQCKCVNDVGHMFISVQAMITMLSL